eukprot:1192099-Prorocentrum_minimum.AAC.6
MKNGRMSGTEWGHRRGRAGGRERRCALGEKLLVDHVLCKDAPALHAVLVEHEDVEPVLQPVLLGGFGSHPYVAPDPTVVPRSART